MSWPVFLLVISLTLGSVGTFGYLAASKIQDQKSVVSECVESKSDYIVGDGSYLKSEVQDLDVSWVGGNVTIAVSDLDEFLVKEDLHGKKVDDNQKMHWKIQDGKLTLTPVKPGKKPSNLKRDLTIHVPKNLESVTLNTVATKITCEVGNLSKFDINVTASDADISLLKAKKLNINGTSANIGVRLLGGLRADLTSSGVAIEGKFDGKHSKKSDNSQCKIVIKGVALTYKIDECGS